MAKCWCELSLIVSNLILKQLRSLLDLPDDILFLFLAHLDDRGRLPLPSVSRFETHVNTGFHTRRTLDHPMISLSLTCRKMRHACLPLVFEFVCFSDRIEAGDPPPVVSYARRLSTETWAATPLRLSECLRTMLNVRTVYFQGAESLLPVVLALPTLEELAIGRSQVTREVAPRSAVDSSKLRSFRMCDHYRVWIAPLDGPSTSHERQWVASLVYSARSTLEELFIPGETASLSMLASNPWPQLKELTVHGACPKLDAPWLQLLAALPNLRALTLAIAPRRDEAPVLVWPRDAAMVPDISRLRRFSISFPSEDDLIFRHLPAELEELSLRDTPRYYMRDRWPASRESINGHYAAPILTCRGLRMIFNSLCATASLIRLEVVVLEDDHLPDLLAHLSTACPRLETFELHRYRDVFEYSDLHKTPPLVTLDDLAHALAAFRTLHFLRLNLEFQWKVFTVHGRCKSIRTAHEFAASIASTVAQALPWLQDISVLTFRADGSNLNREWRTWAVSVDDGTVRLDKVEYGRRSAFSRDLSYV